MTIHPSAGDEDATRSASDEAWVVSANPELRIRLRSLTAYLQRGGVLRDARLVEAEDGGWTVWVRLADRPGECRINHFKSDQPKVYRNVALAVALCREDLGYFGPITLVTDRGPLSMSVPAPLD